MKKQVFIVMPSDEFEASGAKRQIIDACALEFGWSLQVPRYDKKAPAFDLESTMKTLRDVDLILVDLTEERPSCYFELGLAEASGSEISVVALKNTPIHQTSFRETVRFFEGLDDFAATVSEILAKPS